MSWFTPEVIAVIVGVLKAIVILLAVVVCGAFLSFVERRLLALWQDRYGPNRVGPFGLFQIAADMLKMFFKEDWTPPFADKLIVLAGEILNVVGKAGDLGGFFHRNFTAETRSRRGRNISRSWTRVGAHAEMRFTRFIQLI